MFGAIIGDIAGSRFEFNNTFRKDFTLFHPNCEFTDDTVMTCAVAQALLDWEGDETELSRCAISAMQRIGRLYPNCGYGARFYHWVFAQRPEPYDSCGNGSAMRISPVGLFAGSVEEAKRLSAAVTRVSHDHPEGMKGAEAVAVAMVMARHGSGKAEIRELVERDYYPDIRSVTYYRETCGGHGKEICQVSVPQAFASFLEGEDFEDVIRNCISIGGDSDTIAAIGGGLAEAFYGVPQDLVDGARAYLDERLLAICDAFQARLAQRD